jgi:hypothetical protein
VQPDLAGLIWDAQVMILYVKSFISVRNLIATQFDAGAGNPYVKVFVEKQKFKTQALKHNEDPTWKELFLLFVFLPQFPSHRGGGCLAAFFIADSKVRFGFRRRWTPESRRRVPELDFFFPNCAALHFMAT